LKLELCGKANFGFWRKSITGGGDNGFLLESGGSPLVLAVGITTAVLVALLLRLVASSVTCVSTLLSAGGDDGGST
jgi:hypothetical protein